MHTEGSTGYSKFIGICSVLEEELWGVYLGLLEVADGLAKLASSRSSEVITYSFLPPLILPLCLVDAGGFKSSSSDSPLANQIQIHVKETRKPAEFFGRSWPSSSTSKKPEFQTVY
ncbi:hypothetical protein V6N11_042066 [Hibiscus sabdariffa]|uniref:Uncharacterized protein n=1 Tax=Hibiscus sabdariffa TaxID=183260 RepID=A0ABR2QVB1_9ROSI